jgi:hypothetical protein
MVSCFAQADFGPQPVISPSSICDYISAPPQLKMHLKYIFESFIFVAFSYHSEIQISVLNILYSNIKESEPLKSCAGFKMYILIFFKISSIPPSTVKSISVFYNDWA